jgi:hypothetical protein
MRRLLYTATFVLVLAGLPVRAQHGGGHVGGGHAGGFGHGSFGGHMSGGHGFGGMHAGPGIGAHGFNRGSAFSRPSLSTRNFSSRNFPRNFGRFRGPIIRNPRFRNRFSRWGWGWGWPWWGYDPWWGWNGYSSYDADYDRDLAIAREMNDQSLAEQRARDERDQDLYARSSPPPQREEEHAEAPVPPTVLVFRDQHQQEVQNYAIVGQMLWAFAPQRTQKIPLADLDVAATTKANDERGVEFKVPSSGEGQ